MPIFSPRELASTNLCVRTEPQLKLGVFEYDVVIAPSGSCETVVANFGNHVYLGCRELVDGVPVGGGNFVYRNGRCEEISAWETRRNRRVPGWELSFVGSGAHGWDTLSARIWLQGRSFDDGDFGGARFMDLDSRYINFGEDVFAPPRKLANHRPSNLRGSAALSVGGHAVVCTVALGKEESLPTVTIDSSYLPKVLTDPVHLEDGRVWNAGTCTYLDVQVRWREWDGPSPAVLVVAVLGVRGEVRGGPQHSTSFGRDSASIVLKEVD